MSRRPLFDDAAPAKDTQNMTSSRKRLFDDPCPPVEPERSVRAPLFNDPCPEPISRSSRGPVFSETSSISACSLEKREYFSKVFFKDYPRFEQESNKACNLACALIVSPEEVTSFGEHLLSLYKKHSADAAELATMIDKKRIAETLDEITRKIASPKKSGLLSFFTKQKDEPLNIDEAENTIRGFLPFLRHIAREPKKVLNSLQIASSELEFYYAILSTLYLCGSSVFDDFGTIEKRLHHRAILLEGSVRGIMSMQQIMSMKTDNIVAWEQEIEKLLTITFPPLRLARTT